MNSRVVVGLLAVAGLSASASAQFTITPGGANAGNGYFVAGAPVTSATGAGPSNANFGATTPSVADQLFANWWWFRGPNDTREYTFANTNTAPFTMSGTLVGNNTGTLDTGGYDFTVNNTVSGYNFRAELRYRIVAEAAGPRVFYTGTFVNLSTTTALPLSVFNYHDFDANATAGGDTWSFTGGKYVITDGPATLDYIGDFSPMRQSTAFSTLRGLLSNTAVDNFNNTDAGSPGDFTAGYQWDLILPPGESVVNVGGSFAIIPSPSSLALLGLGGLLAARRRR